ncbi:hypothetical protein [Nocardia sp. NPDC051832]|uniref:hypothetical protein n=1 Tax=Nocardia sp. NPDC051832 TaxID=3155673 RepID=UPI003424019B
MDIAHWNDRRRRGSKPFWIWGTILLALPALYVGGGLKHVYDSRDLPRLSVPVVGTCTDSTSTGPRNFGALTVKACADPAATLKVVTVEVNPEGVKLHCSTGDDWRLAISSGWEKGWMSNDIVSAYACLESNLILGTCYLRIGLAQFAHDPACGNTSARFDRRVAAKSWDVAREKCGVRAPDPRWREYSKIDHFHFFHATDNAVYCFAPIS